jgi:hypothetical protein
VLSQRLFLLVLLLLLLHLLLLVTCPQRLTKTELLAQERYPSVPHHAQ